MKAKHFGNQGDVHLGKIDEFPTDLYQDDQCKQGILGFGELSGHVHEVTREDLDFVSIYKSKQKEYDNLLFIDVRRKVNFRHGKQQNFKGKEVDQDYHKPFTLPAGKYVSGIVPETDHLTGLIRRVVD